MKYNYVIFGSDNDYTRAAFSDIAGKDGIKYLYRKIDTKSKFLTFLYSLHTSIKTNKLFPLPFKKVWNGKAFKNTFDDGKPICFLLLAGNRWCNAKYIAYLRKKYKDAKIVLYFMDLVKMTKPSHGLEVMPLCDLTMTYDKSDAEKYKMKLYQDVFSNPKIENAKIEYDVCCIMKAKDRLKKAIDVYDHLEVLGLKSYFYFTDVSESEQIQRENVYYGKKLPYGETLEIVAKSKAILEILQEGSKGYTFRTCEAVTMGKKLLTDNRSVKEEPFYTPENVCVFDNANEITADFFVGSADYKGFENYFSPIKLIDYLDKTL
ncbi:MAG: hypothetical protein SPL13_02225 [Clostridia bacterium]|nr:hypothetical protein [Clostridia bacterium]